MMTAPHYYLYPFAIGGDTDLSDAEVPNLPPVSPPGGMSYDQGYTPNYQGNLTTDDTALPVNRGQMNKLFYDLTYNIQQYQQQSIPNWYSTVSGGYPLYAYVIYTDGNIYFNLVAGNVTTPSVDSSWLNITNSYVMPGTIIDWGGSSVPTGYFNCDGSAISIATYPQLFANIGYTWGNPASGYFSLPNLQGYATAGSGGGSILPISTPGQKYGSQNHAITIDEMPAHTHPGSTFPGSHGPNATSGGADAYNNAGTTALSIATQGNGTAMSLVQPTAITMKCIKY